MGKLYKIGLLVIILLCWRGAVQVKAEEFKFVAEVDRTQITQADMLVLSFIISGDNMVTNVTPTLPDLSDDFDVLQGPNRSSSISIINGQYTSSITYQYVLSPKKEGTLTIDSATVRHNQNTYSTDPITIEVTPQAQSPSGAHSPVPQQQAGEPDDVYIRAEIDKQRAYIGEQLTLSYSLYTRVRVAGYDFKQQPDFNGFWVEDVEIPSPPSLQYQYINGVKYGVALLKKVALFPTSSGDVTIDPMVMAFSVRLRTRPGTRSTDPFDQFFSDPFFNRTQEILRKTAPLDIQILPLPEEGKPATFNGDVGSFTMDVNVDKTSVKQNDPISLIITIRGIGNIKTVKAPNITLPASVKRYDPEISEQLFTHQSPVQGEKTFRTVLIPSESGEIRIEPVQFSYFDPREQRYQTLQSQPFEIHVQAVAEEEAPLERHIGAKEEIKLLGQDIRFIRSNVGPLENQGGYDYQQPWFFPLHALPVLLLFILWGGKRYQEKYQNDAQYVRQKRARKHSKKRFNVARQALEVGDVQAFHAAVSSALRQYIGDKLTMPSANLSAEEAASRLREYGLDAETATRLKDCLEACDFARFAPAGADNTDMQAILRQAETIVQQIEKLNIRTARQKSGIGTFFIGVLCTALLLNSGTAQAAASMVDDLFQEGNACYERGDYQGAAARYQQILAAGIQNGYVYYNLGNALLKEQRIGEAILAYERAKRFLPRDDDVTFNLDYARALTLDKLESWHSGKILGALAAFRDSFTPNEVSAVFSSMVIVLTVLGGLMIVLRGSCTIRLLYLAILPGLLLLLSGGLLLAQIHHAATVDEAIVLREQVEARTGPDEGYSTVFEMHEGAKVRIQRKKGEWVEIQLPNKVIGWVQHDALVSIHEG